MCGDEDCFCVSSAAGVSGFAGFEDLSTVSSVLFAAAFTASSFVMRPSLPVPLTDDGLTEVSRKIFCSGR